MQQLSAGVGQAGGDVPQAPAILSLGVGDGAVLLAEVEPELTLVSEMEVTLFTLKSKKTKQKNNPTIKVLRRGALRTNDGGGDYSIFSRHTRLIWLTLTW